MEGDGQVHRLPAALDAHKGLGGKDRLPVLISAHRVCADFGCEQVHALADVLGPGELKVDIHAVRQLQPGEGIATVLAPGDHAVLGLGIVSGQPPRLHDLAAHNDMDQQIVTLRVGHDGEGEGQVGLIFAILITLAHSQTGIGSKIVLIDEGVFVGGRFRLSDQVVVECLCQRPLPAVQVPPVLSGCSLIVAGEGVLPVDRQTAAVSVGPDCRLSRRQGHTVCEIGVESPRGSHTVIAAPVDLAVVVGVHHHLFHSVQAPGPIRGSPVALLGDSPDMRRRLAVIVPGILHVLHVIAETRLGADGEIGAVDVVLVAVLVHQDILVGLPAVAGGSGAVLIGLDRIHPDGALQAVLAQPLEAIAVRVKFHAVLIRTVVEIGFLVRFAHVRLLHVRLNAVGFKDAVIFTGGDTAHSSGNGAVAGGDPLRLGGGGPGRGGDGPACELRKGHGGDRHIGHFG